MIILAGIGGYKRGTGFIGASLTVTPSWEQTLTLDSTSLTSTTALQNINHFLHHVSLKSLGNTHMKNGYRLSPA